LQLKQHKIIERKEENIRQIKQKAAAANVSVKDRLNSAKGNHQVIPT
jgi:hypothetical protein